MNTIIFNSQLYFTDEKLIFWTKFYLLLDFDFKSKFQTTHDYLEKEFYRNFGVSSSLNFDTFLDEHNISTFLNIVENIISSEPLTNNEIYKDFFDCYLLKGYEQKKIRNLLSHNSLDKNNLKEHFIFLKTALNRKSFYDLTFAKSAEFIGEWISTKETGQLRINYNMTDLTPIGTQIRLSIQKHHEDFYLFTCLAKAHDYMFDKTHDVEVFATLIKMENGYIHHYRKDDLVFIYKRPIYNFRPNTFITQTYDIEFTFEKHPEQTLQSNS